MGRRKERVSQAPRGEAGQRKVRKVTAQRWRWLSSSGSSLLLGYLYEKRATVRIPDHRNPLDPKGTHWVRLSPPAQLGTEWKLQVPEWLCLNSGLEEEGPTCCGVGSGARFARRLRILRSDICSLTATGGIRAIVAGSRVTSAFMSLSSSSSCFRTAEEGKKRVGELWWSRLKSLP